MKMRLFNSLTKKIEELTPLNEDCVSIYSCGPTVYDNVHIGNLSAFITADTLRRAISSQGAAVKHVMNFTDVDDKTIYRSQLEYPELEPMEALRTLTALYSNQFLSDIRQVGIDVDKISFIKAADETTIKAMQQLIIRLYEGGFAYITDDGIYFSIKAYRQSGKTYGQLVFIPDDRTDNGRIQNDEYDKESANDFALWKKKKTGEPYWNFKINGMYMHGRPGWHIECSAMSRMTLGKQFDIHTGGIDLAFPHHENEIAQSTAGEPDSLYASIFLHNEHILVDGKKMAKSQGNFFTLADITENGYEPIVFRLLVLQSHYRKATDFSNESMIAAAYRLRHWRAIAAMRWQTSDTGGKQAAEDILKSEIAMSHAMTEDLDTVNALRIIDELFSRLEKCPAEDIPAPDLGRFIIKIDELLGLGLIEATPDISSEMKELIQKRDAARKNKEWEVSDQIRKELLDRNIGIKDTSGNSYWYYEN